MEDIIISGQFHMWFFILATCVSVIAFTREDIPLEVTSLCLLMALLLFGQLFPLYSLQGENLLSAQSILAGFSNPSLIAVLALLVMGQGMMTASAAMLIIFVAVGEMLLYFGIFLLISWLITKLVGALSNKAADFGRIAGSLSYTGAAFYLFIGLPLGIITLLIMSVTGSYTTLNPVAGAGMFIGIIVIGLVMLLVAIWEWMIAGKAVAIISDTSWGTGIAAVLLGLIILVLIAVLVGFIFGLAFFSMMGMSSMSSPAGFAMAGL